MTHETELSERENEILRLVATGASNKEIAQQLAISANTVKVHLRNIFAKIGVTSRTEATLYAIREGLVPAPTGITASGSASVIEAEEALAGYPETSNRKTGLSLQRGMIVLGLFVLALFIGLMARPLFVPETTPTPLAAAPERWQVKSPMPEARSGMAVAVYANQIYLIGGETASGVTGAGSLYQPSHDAWKEIASKPMAVTDASAAMIGGKIYIPGGRTSSGQPTSVVEVYDPLVDRWQTCASLPVALSGYALASLEGRLYVFGGWDGKQALASTYEYDPAQDRWQARTAMPTARMDAGAAVVSGKIYVVGGTDAGRQLSANDVYSPEIDRGGGSPWAKAKPLPEGRAGMGVVGLVDALYVVGGATASSQTGPMIYQPQEDAWQVLENPAGKTGVFPGVVAYQNYLYIFGGKQGSTWSDTTLAYQAIYTISIPIVR